MCVRSDSKWRKASSDRERCFPARVIRAMPPLLRIPCSIVTSAFSRGSLALCSRGRPRFHRSGSAWRSCDMESCICSNRGKNVRGTELFHVELPRTLKAKRTWKAKRTLKAKRTSRRSSMTNPHRSRAIMTATQSICLRAGLHGGRGAVASAL